MSDVLMELLLLLLAVRILLCYGVQIGVVNLRLRPENNVKIIGEFFFSSEMLKYLHWFFKLILL